MLDTKGVLIYPLAKIVNAENVTFGHNVIIDDFVFIVARQAIRIGNYVHIASFTSITGGGVFILGDYSTLSSGVRIFTGTEELTEPSLLGSAVPPPYRNPLRSLTQIAQHCMIGANTVVLPGVNLPEGVVIGAMSLVRENDHVSPWTIWAGNPLHYIKDRPREAILALAAQLEQERVCEN
jgi:galactoside O-acetyltransferase